MGGGWVRLFDWRKAGGLGSDDGVKVMRQVLFWVALGGVGLGVSGCDEIALPSKVSNEERAREALQAGEYPRAVWMYEAMLDGTAKTADVHFNLALIYDDKLKDPVSALHHYRRFTRMAENPARKAEVKAYIDRIELELATRAADGGVITKREGARLKNESLALAEEVTKLKAELAAERKKPKAAVAAAAGAKPKERASQGFSTNPKTAAAERAVGAETRTYSVQKGDTLASIARKFYGNAQRWKDVADANHNALNGTVNLQIGQVLVIPE